MQQADFMPTGADQRRALTLLAGSPGGCTVSIMLAHGLTPEFLAVLVRNGLAAAKPETVHAGPGRTIEIVRMKITDTGRKAINAG
jgi:hypothetical protein